MQSATASAWLVEAPFHVDSTDLPSDCDTVIVGAGMTGASTALHLARSNVKAVVLEARVISGGATGRNGGLCWPSGGNTAEARFEHAVVKDLEDLLSRLLSHLLSSLTSSLTSIFSHL